jgi:MFS family permease
MPSAIVSISALLLGASMLLWGNGLQGILLPVRATIEAFSTSTIGLIASGYSIGFVISCRYAPHIVQRVGHIRSFAVLASIGACVVLLFVLVVDPLMWIVLRMLSGFCFAGLYMVIESWLNESAENSNRGQIFSTYMVINLSAITLGQLVLPLGDPAGFELFAVTAIAVGLALVPIGLTTSTAPRPVRQVQLRLGRLYRMSPVGLAGCFFVGLANGAFGGLGAVFADAIGMSTTGIALFMSAALVGGALVQLPLGRLSDRIDRRQVIALSCSFAMVFGLMLAALGDGHDDTPFLGLGWLTAPLHPAVLIAVVALYGGFAYPLYGLCVAHTNDFVSREDFIEASSGLLLTWGIGASIGPLLAALAMEQIGLGGLFLYTALVHSSFALVTLYRMTRREAVPAPERADFVRHETTTPVAAALDPRAPDLPEGAATAMPAAEEVAQSPGQVSSEASTAPREAMK